MEEEEEKQGRNCSSANDRQPPRQELFFFLAKFSSAKKCVGLCKRVRVTSGDFLPGSGWLRINYSCQCLKQLDIHM